MAWFQLDPESIAARVKAAGGGTRAPTLAESVSRGGLGFMLVSLAGFLPWTASEFWLRSMGEIEVYAASVVVFIGLSGICLHRLIIGPGSLARFYKLFTVAFVGYAVAWVGLWVWLRGDAGAYGGLLAGVAAMGTALSLGFGTLRSAGMVVPLLFIPHILGYLAGEWIADQLGFKHRLAAMLGWGACYGLGLGVGLGLAFFLCQQAARRALAADSPHPSRS